MLIGAWRLSTPEPGIATTTRLSQSNVQVRIVAIILAGYFIFPVGLITENSPELRAVIIGAGLLLIALFVWLVGTHLSGFTQRIPDRKLFRFTAVGTWLFAIGLSGMGVLAFFAPWFGTTKQTEGIVIGPYTLSQVFFQIVGIPLGLIFIVGMLIAIAALWDYRKAFARAAKFGKGDLSALT